MDWHRIAAKDNPYFGPRVTVPQEYMPYAPHTDREDWLYLRILLPPECPRPPSPSPSPLLTSGMDPAELQELVTTGENVYVQPTYDHFVISDTS